MPRDLTESDRARLADALHECIEVARTYRHTIGDEDSILLLRNLSDIAETLDIDIPLETP